MRTKLTHLFLTALFAVLAVSWTLAQDSDNDSKSKGEVRTITGCLSKGDSSNEFLLTASDGSTWEIHGNNSVDLASHLNQTVSAKGVVAHSKMHNMKEDAKDAAKDSGMKKDNNEHGHFKVTDVQTVSDSCQK